MRSPWVGWLVATLAWGAVASAQTPRVPKDPKPKAEEAAVPESGERSDEAKAEEQKSNERPSLFGDPKKFTATSGWGGMGASMAQMGFARSMLIALPAVQEDLELTDEQKEELKAWGEAMRDRGQEMTKGMRDQARQPMSAGRFALDLPAMLNTMQSLMKENETGFGAILTAGQRKRLEQIAWQMEGITVLAKPEVAEAVKLHDHQFDRIQQILAQSKTRQVMYWMNQTRQMWTERSAARKESGQEAARTDEPARPPAPATAESDLEEDPVAKARKAEQEKRRKEQTARFEKMRTGSDEIQDSAVAEILKVLTPKQKRRFESLLGEPFDPERVTDGMVRTERARENGEGRSGTANREQ